MLTGESVPVIKKALPDVASEDYSETLYNKETLFGGTTVIQTRKFTG